MILLSKVDSIVESLYTGTPLTERYGEADILVNPENVTYTTGKTVIISDLSYPGENIKALIGNGCRVISRLGNRNGETYMPYLPRMCPEVMWSGETRGWLDENIYSEVPWSFDGTYLYYPKSRGWGEIHGDTPDSVSALGWLMYQVGERIYPKSPFQDLDMVKLGKGI